MKCPYCSNDDEDLIEKINQVEHKEHRTISYLCSVCARTFSIEEPKEDV
jgi:transposase-like protein